MNAYTPRSYQQICLENLASAREQGANKALVVMASGLGKTLTGAFDVLTYLSANPNGRVLVLCHSKDILEQTKEVFKDLFGDGYSYGMYNGTEKAAHRTDFLFANLQSVNLHMDAFDPEEFAFIIVDEAHHSPATTYREAIEHFRPQFLLGMTATPERMDDADLSEIFGKTVFEYRLESAVRDGWLSEVEYRVKTDELQKLETILDSGEKFSLSQLNREIFAPKRDEEIIRIIRKEISGKDNPTMVIFCQTIAHAEKFAELMGDAVVIHSQMSIDERNRRLQGFRTGEIRTICAVDILNEGIDVPRTDVIVFLRVTQSKIVFTQQLGRGLRRAEGKDKVLVLDFVSTADRLDMLFHFEREFKAAEGRYPRKKVTGEREYFTLDIDASVFQDRKVDIIALIERARNYYVSVSNEEMLQMLRDFGEKLGHVPSSEEVNADFGMPSSSTYANRFGGFTEAIIKAGFTVKPINKRFTDDELLESLRVCAERLGRIPTAKDLRSFSDMPSGTTYRLRFGGLMQATELAGLGKSRGAYDLSNTEMLDLLRAFGDKLGRRPTAVEVQNDSELPSPGCYANRFGSLTKASDLAGLPKQKHSNQKVSDAELITSLQQFAKRIGHTPTMAEITADPDMPNGGLYAKRFGDYHKALEHAGLKILYDLSDKELLSLLWNLGERLNRTPGKRDVDMAEGIPNSTFYKKRFGSFSAAILAAGFTEVAQSGRRINAKA